MHFKMYNGLRRRVALIAREGEATDTLETSETPETPETPVAPVTPKVEEPLLPQSKVNSLVAEERRKAKAQNDKVLLQLTQFQQSASLTAAEHQALQQQIEELRTASMTKEQLAAQKLKEAQDKAANEVKNVKAEAEKYKSLFESHMIERAIIDAALPKAHNANQFIPVLAPKARAVEILNDANQPTGRYEVKIKLDTVGVDGRPGVLDLTPVDAVAQLEKDDNFSNFFKSFQRPGTGFNPSKTTPTAKSVKDMSHEEYLANRGKFLDKPAVKTSK